MDKKDFIKINTKMGITISEEDNKVEITAFKTTNSRFEDEEHHFNWIEETKEYKRTATDKDFNITYKNAKNVLDMFIEEEKEKNKEK